MKKRASTFKSHLKEDDESDDPDSSESQEDIDSAKNDIDEAVDQATDPAEDLISPNGGRGRHQIGSEFLCFQRL